MIQRCDKPAHVLAQVKDRKRVVAMCEDHAERAKEIGALLEWQLVFEKARNGEKCQIPKVDNGTDETA